MHDKEYLTIIVSDAVHIIFKTIELSCIFLLLTFDICANFVLTIWFGFMFELNFYDNLGTYIAG